MAKVTLRETPSEQLIKQASSEVTVTDAKGRVITLKKPGPLAPHRFLRILGNDSNNEGYVNSLSIFLYVSQIDGEDVLFPNSLRELEALIQRLDDEGKAALMQGIIDNFIQTEDNKEELKK